MSLELSPEIETAIRARANAEGVSVNELLARTFASSGRKTEVELESGALRDPIAHVQALLAKLQAEDDTPKLPPIAALPGETPTQALFRQWEAEDAQRTEAEKEADARLWEEFQQGINALAIKGQGLLTGSG